MLGASGLLSVKNITQKQAISFFKRVSFETLPLPHPRLTKAGGIKIGVLAFFEPSTRTRLSFEVTGLSLGIQWIHLNSQDLSLQKGETYKNTFETLSCYKPSLIVVRHSQSYFSHWVHQWSGIPVINAGDGQNEHPTQALLDAYTLWKLNPQKKWKIAFFGDVVRSRVVRSDIYLFKTLGYKTFVTDNGSTDTRLFAKAFSVPLISRKQLPAMDVIQCLRVQQERGSVSTLSPLNKNDLGAHTKVMHPGPVIMGQDMDKTLSHFSAPWSLMHEQVKNGLLVRTLLLSDLLRTMSPSLSLLRSAFNQRRGKGGGRVSLMSSTSPLILSFSSRRSEGATRRGGESMIFFTQNLWNENKGRFEPGTFRIQNSHFSDMTFGKPQGTRVRKKILDYGKLFIAPSGIDPHVHSRGFDESYKETAETLEAAALKGGVSVAACMANTKPCLDSEKMIQQFLNIFKKSKVYFIPFATVTKNLEGKEATAWDQLLKMPIAGLSDDGKPILDVKMLEGALKITKKFKKILSLHEEDPALSRGSLLHLSETSLRLGVEGSSSEAESTLVKRDLEIAAKLQAPIHLAHISSKESVGFIRQAKKKGVEVSAELTPHHALLYVREAEKLPPEKLSLFKVCPPIRSEEDQRALARGVLEGTVDCFSSDHAPHSALEKNCPLEEAAHGIISLEYYFSLWNEFRIRNRLPWRRFFQCFSGRPAEVLGMSKRGHLGEGFEASFLVFDPKGSQGLRWTLSRSSNTPLEDFKVRGIVHEHWIKGQKVYDRG